MNRDLVRAFDSADSAVAHRSSNTSRARSHVLAIERWLVRRLLLKLDQPPIRIVLWNGEEITTSSQSPVARVVLRDRAALYRLLVNPEFQFGELYSHGRIDVEGNLVALIESVNRSTSRNGTFKSRLPGWLDRQKRNTRARAQANIHHHYDIGNGFYRLWLDDQLVYTCAYFPTPNTTLEAAQLAKMDHVCRKLRLKPGESVVEAGCGWGALALHMARHYGVTVKAFNISHQQIALARERAKSEGLHDRVQFIEDDYRNITGTFDAFVSVGMLEHVGPGNYRALGAVIDRCLTPAGRGLIHTIGRNRPHRTSSWIATRIFPGGYTPSLKEMAEIFEPHAFSVIDVENLRLHYARTLQHWLERFEAHESEVRRMFDERFVRMWRLYLAGSQAAFTTGWMQLFQVVFQRATNNDVPLTREHLYRYAK